MIPDFEAARRDLRGIGAGDVSRETFDRLAVFARTLEKWQGAYNLVSSQTLPSLWQRHILDSAQLFRFLGSGCRIADLGSGAGFPGLVLALLGNDTGTCVTLIESNRKKCSFLAEVIRQTGVSATIVPTRIEETPPLRADTVTARALTEMDKLLDYTHLHGSPGGQALFLKGETADLELTRARRSWTFDLETHSSRTHPGGTIFKITRLSPRSVPA